MSGGSALNRMTYGGSAIAFASFATNFTARKLIGLPSTASMIFIDWLRKAPAQASLRRTCNALTCVKQAEAQKAAPNVNCSGPIGVFVTGSHLSPLRSMRAMGTIYTCPMHPQIRQAGPGTCPICGMALEPVEPVSGGGPNPELADMTRRFWIGLALAAPVVALEMGEHFTNLHVIVGQAASNW